MIPAPSGQEDPGSFKVITVTQESRDALVEAIAKEIRRKR